MNWLRLNDPFACSLLVEAAVFYIQYATSRTTVRASMYSTLIEGWDSIDIMLNDRLACHHRTLSRSSHSNRHINMIHPSGLKCISRFLHIYNLQSKRMNDVQLEVTYDAVAVF